MRTSRHGHFWVAAERAVRGDGTYQRGPMFVEREALERVMQSCPVVLVHAGTLQGTEWGDTPDGHPGWAQRLVEAGRAVLVVDRSGRGRSPCHADRLTCLLGLVRPRGHGDALGIRPRQLARRGRDGRGEFAKAAPAIADFLAVAGAAVERIHLPNHGIYGNGHGLTYEKNSDGALQLVLQWLAAHAGAVRNKRSNP